VTSCLEGLPVRVVRGADPRSAHAPDHGYRYDGVLWVDSYWRHPGADGFMVCRFRLVKEPELRGDVAADAVEEGALASVAPRVEATILRVVRDTELGRRVKLMYDFSCQICRTRLDCAGGPYAEAAHVRPLGRPHNGPDALENLLCLCPNHHVLLDNGAFTINDDLSFSGLNGRLVVVPGHSVSPAHLAYRRQMWQLD
jgi:putative restriction endonuclease